MKKWAMIFIGLSVGSAAVYASVASSNPTCALSHKGKLDVPTSELKSANLKPKADSSVKVLANAGTDNSKGAP